MTTRNIKVLTSEWSKYATSDLKVAKDNFGLENYAFVCYLCQQATEKYLKAYLVSKNQKPPLIHSIEILLKRCAKFDTQFKKFTNFGKTLDEYFIPTRYPIGMETSYTRAEAVKALRLAKKVIDLVEKHI